MKQILYCVICLCIFSPLFSQTNKGNACFEQAKYRQALYWYEKGIDIQPEKAENYYGATKVFLLSTEIVWAMMYGEIFMNLSDSDSLRKEISKSLFEEYSSAFSLNKDKNIASFNSNIIVYSDSFERRNLFPTVFDNLMTESVKRNIKFIDIAALISIREKFLTMIRGNSSDFNNPLFDYWQQIITKGHWEAYNYWLFAYGNTSESATWIRKNSTKWTEFLEWHKDNGLVLTKDYYFSRYLME